MGKNHVRNIMELSNYYEYVGCFDESWQNAKSIQDRYGAEVFPDGDSLMSRTNAVVIAAPSYLHRKYGEMAIKHNKHALIEKPLALTEADGASLKYGFEHINKVLSVGHVERYNPVVTEMKKILLDENEIIAIEARRCSPFDARIADTNVVFDLMIHDLDIVLNYLQPSSLASFHAEAIIVNSKNHCDFVQALIKHNSGAISNIVASRVTEDKIRMINVHTKQAYIQGDLLNKSLTLTRKTNLKLDIGYTPTYKQENIIEKIILPNIEPLKAELMEFAHAINDKRQPLTDGNDAVKSLGIAERISSSVSNCPHLAAAGDANG